MPKDSTPPAAPKPRTLLKRGKTVVVCGAMIWVGAEVYQAGQENAPGAIRYPVAVEYALAKTCTEETSLFMTARQKKALEQQCLCAVERVEHKVSYATLKDNPAAFTTAFRRASEACS